TPPPPPKDTTAPVVTKVGATGRLRHGRAGKLHATLSEPATVRVSLARLLKGHRVKGRCLTGKHRGKACTVARKAGSLKAVAVAAPGVATVALPAKVAGKALARGRYRLTVTAT